MSFKRKVRNGSGLLNGLTVALTIAALALIATSANAQTIDAEAFNDRMLNDTIKEHYDAGRYQRQQPGVMEDGLYHLPKAQQRAWNRGFSAPFCLNYRCGNFEDFQQGGDHE